VRGRTGATHTSRSGKKDTFYERAVYVVGFGEEGLLVHGIV